MNILDLARQCGASGGTKQLVVDESVLTALESRIRADERERCAKEVPTTWLHPLLTGKEAVLPERGPIGPQHIEALLRGVAAAIRNSEAPVAKTE